MQGRREEETGDVYGTYIEDFRRPRTQQMGLYCRRIPLESDRSTCVQGHISKPIRFNIFLSGNMTI